MMSTGKIFLGIMLLTFISLSRVKATCVWNSDFGFTLDCAFKKSSLFRVRNLGGIKTHVGLGFTVGDDLLFPESLSNGDSKRRSVSNRDAVLATANSLNQNQGQTQTTSKDANQTKKKNRLTVRIPSTSPATPTKSTDLPVVTVEESPLKSGRSQASVRQLSLNRMPSQTIPPFKPIPSAGSFSSSAAQTITAQKNPSRIGQVPKGNFVNISPAPMRVMGHGQNSMTVGQSIGVVNSVEPTIKTGVSGVGNNNVYPQFHVLPASTTKVLNQPNEIPRPVGSVSVVSTQNYPTPIQAPKLSATGYEQVANRKVYEEQSNSFKPIYQQSLNGGPNPQFSYSQLANYVAKPSQSSKVDTGLSKNIITGSSPFPNVKSETTLYEKILAISKATNISVEAIEAAIKLRQQQLISQMINSPPSTTSTSTTTTTTSTTRRPIPSSPKRHSKPSEPAQKVMNAPKEYYPVGYDKNFDDNFETKVDLPDTSFYCGDQKHFPGLYGDEDLGCMVFHVCALTDEGLIMKSFLCPESTLFDQTILKCNWWFYVDCKNTKNLYDSNIPISKSYQLMKALTFFSSYKKETVATDQKTAQSKIQENEEGVNNAIKILHKQSHMELPKVEVTEVQPTRKVFSMTNEGTPVDAVEVNSLSTPVDESENNAAEKIDRAEKQFKNHRSVSIERKNPPKYATKIAISPTSSSFRSSTQKSVKMSTSQEKKHITRRPTYRIGSKETLNKTSSESDSHRSERASAERQSVEDIVKIQPKPAVFPTPIPTVSTVLPTVVRTVVSVQEVTGTSKSQVITPSRQSADETIAKLDEAIMGKQK